MKITKQEVFLLLLLASFPAATQTVRAQNGDCSTVVNSTADTVDADPNITTLREAIECANATPNVDGPDADALPDADVITFAIPANDPRHVYYLDDNQPGQVSRFAGNGDSRLATTTEADDANIPTTGASAIDPDWARSWYSIQLANALPAVTEAAVIDGYTQTGAAANSNAISANSNTVLRIELTAATGNEFDGLLSTGGGSTVRGLCIQGFGFFNPANGIDLESAANKVEGNHLGADVSGLSGLGNTASGAYVGAANNVIGGTAAAARNLIVAGRDGIRIAGSGATGNAVQGNLIRNQPNGSGVAITGGASQNTVGGAVAAARNVITGSQVGVLISGVNDEAIPFENFVQGNFIGTDITGTESRPNNDGVLITNSPRNVVGGLTGTPGTGAGNVIVSGLYGVFVALEQSTGNRVEGNLIGTNASGTAVPAPNGQFFTGVLLSGGGGNIVGGSSAQARNVISGSARRAGISLQENNSLVQNNFIGTDIAGTGDLGNGGGGIHVRGSDNLIRDNVIAFSKLFTEEGGAPFGSGVIVMAGSGHSILANSIFSNARLGIELQNGSAPDGVPWPNDTCDEDSGPNNLQNFPVLASAASADGNTTVSGTLNSSAFDTFRIEFFSSPVCDASGNGEGRTFLGAREVTTGADCNASIDETLPGTVAGGSFITATASLLRQIDAAAATNAPAISDPTGSSTSEFSACVQVAGTAPSVQFSAATYNVSEGAGVATLTVTRTGDTFGASSVHYATSNGTATAASDYTETSGDLTFTAGETSKTFTVAITDDTLFEGDETFTATLTAPNNAALGSPSTATVTITDNDTQPTPSPTPSATPTPSPNPTATPVTVQLLNISGRAAVGINDEVSIAGFIVKGGNGKRVIARGIGPSLTVDGAPLAAAMQDPILELRDGNGQLIRANDNWRGAQESEIEASGLAPSDNREAAVIATLNAGDYTAIIRGANASSGVGLIEIYDLDPTGAGELANLSVRALVLTNDNVLINGLILRGGTPRRVLFRAIGPSLTNNDTAGALQNPTLDLHGPNGELLASNDDWSDAPNAAEIEASGLAPDDDRESAILLPLPPANYTSIVRGVDGTTGIALAEAYNLD